MATFDYCGEVNENLLCAICHCPFIEPVTLHGCMHTFCGECLSSLEVCNISLPSFSLSIYKQECPVDRQPIRGFDAANRLIQNICNELKVRCRHCEQIMERQLLEPHLTSDEQCERCGQKISPACTLDSHVCQHPIHLQCTFRKCTWQGEDVQKHLMEDCQLFARLLLDQKLELANWLASKNSTEPPQSQPKSIQVCLDDCGPILGSVQQIISAEDGETFEADLLANDFTISNSNQAAAPLPLDLNWSNMLHLQNALQRQLIILQNELYSLRSQLWAMERRQQHQKHSRNQLQENGLNASSDERINRSSGNITGRMKL
jgi:hypothetical protein